MKIRQEDLTPVTHGLITEASQIRLQPGQWPDELTASGDAEPKVFYRASRLGKGLTTEGYEYLSTDGILLTVIND